MIVMNDFEVRVMKAVTEQHIRNNPVPIVKNVKEFVKAWRDRQFRPTFIKVIHEKLTENQRIVIYKRYGEQWLYSDIADELELSIARIKEIESTAINRLADITVYKELYIGKDEYQKLMEQTREKIDKALQPDKPEDMLVSNINLNGRAFNLIARTVLCPEVELTAKKAIEKINDLTDIEGCGLLTALHIINRFKDEGIDVTKWENALSQQLDTPYLQTMAKNYMALDEKRKYRLGG